MAVVWVLPAEAAQSASVLSGGQDIDLLRIVILDVSGSMDQVEARKAHSRLDTARQEILESIRQLPVSSKTPVVLIPFCEKVRDDLESIYRDEKSLKEAIVQLAPNGGTNIAAGLERAAKRASELGLCKNILLYLYSDGEHNVGSKNLVYEQEKNLDKVFGLRASRGLSQTVVVKRWGKVLGQLVAHLQKSPHVNVVDAGELELGTVTLVPSVRVRNLTWQNVASGMANIQIDVTVNNHGKITLPAQTSIRITCPSPGSRWLTAPMMMVTRPVQTQTFSLVVKLDPKKFDLARSYALLLQFHGPSQVKTDKGLLIVVINPKQVSCVLPTGYLRPIVEVTARLYRQGKPQWKDLDKRIAVWPMRLQLTITTTPPFAWSEKIQWNIQGLNGVKVSTDGPVVLQGRPEQVNVKLTRQVSLDQLIQGKPFSVQIELRAVNKPKTVILSSMRIVLTIQIEPPAIQITRIEQKVSFVGEPQWADLTTGLVTVPIKLDIKFDGTMAPRTILGLIPYKDIVKVEGIPITVHSGRQTISITLTGKVTSAGSLVKWQLQLKPPPPSYGIRYIEPPPVTVSFVAPGPL
ncbi:MAG: vWA domain-containing protein, partial [Sedimentisphaerales bacterium]